MIRTATETPASSTIFQEEEYFITLETLDTKFVDLFKTVIEEKKIIDPDSLNKYLFSIKISEKERNYLIAVFKITIPWFSLVNDVHNSVDRMINEIASLPKKNLTEFLAEISPVVMTQKATLDRLLLLKKLKNTSVQNRKNVLENALLLKANNSSENLYKQLLHVPLCERNEVVAWIKDLIQNREVKDLPRFFKFVEQSSTKERENYRSLFSELQLIDDENTLCNLLYALKAIPHEYRYEMLKVAKSLEIKGICPLSSIDAELLSTVFVIPKKRLESVLDQAAPLASELSSNLLVTWIKTVNKFLARGKSVHFGIYLKIFVGFKSEDLVSLFQKLITVRRKNIEQFFNVAGKFLPKVSEFYPRKECFELLLTLTDEEIQEVVAEALQIGTIDYLVILKAILKIPKESRKEIVNECSQFYRSVDKNKLSDLFDAVLKISKERRSQLLLEVDTMIKEYKVFCAYDLADVILILDRIPLSDRKDLLEEMAFFQQDEKSFTSYILNKLLNIPKKEYQTLKSQLQSLWPFLKSNVYRIDAFEMFSKVASEDREKWIKLILPWVYDFYNPCDFIKFFLQLPNDQKPEFLNLCLPFKKLKDCTLGTVWAIEAIKPEIREEVTSLVAGCNHFLDSTWLTHYLVKLSELEKNEREELVKLIKSVDFPLSCYSLFNNLISLKAENRRDVFNAALPVFKA